MALKKRAAPAASPAVPAKKPLTTKAHVTKQCNVIATAVKAATGYPPSVLNIVGGNLPDCLGVPKEERHPFHQELIGMVGEVLQSVETSLNNKVSTAESRLSSDNAEKATRDAAHDTAKTDLATKNETLAAAKTAHQESSTAVKAAKGSLAEKEVAQAEGNVKFDDATQKKARIDSALNDAFTPLEEGSASGQAAKAKIATVLKAAKECELDSSLLSSLSATLGKTPAERGTFDALVCQQAKEGLQTALGAVESNLASGEEDRTKRAEAVDVAKADLEKAVEKDNTCKVAADQSKNEVEAAKVHEKDTAKSISQFAHQLNQSRKDLTAVRAELEAFSIGAMAAYKELLEHTDIVPVAPEAEPTGAASASAEA